MQNRGNKKGDTRLIDDQPGTIPISVSVELVLIAIEFTKILKGIGKN